jgi:hypothetical protein
MSFPPAPFAVDPRAPKRIDVLFDELSELCGQRNAIDGRIVDIVAEINGDGDHDEKALWGNTGCRSIAALVAWRTGCSLRNAETVVAVAHRAAVFPRCTEALREGRLSLDQVGVIAEGAADGSDDHYLEFAAVATVSQLRKAVSLEPKPDPTSTPKPQRSISKYSSGTHHLENHPAQTRRREVRRCPGLTPRGTHRGLDTRPRTPRRHRSLCRHRTPGQDA